MKTKIFMIAILVMAMGLHSCKNSSEPKSKESLQLTTGDNSQTSLDWTGTYSGLVPCASCPGIFLVVSLNPDMTYIREMKYMDESDDYIRDEGKFTWNDAGNTITLDGNNPDEGFKIFQVNENQLTLFDTNGNKVTGELADNYIIKKVNTKLVEVRWVLREVNGKEIKLSRKDATEPHIIFRIKENRVNGNGGCNGFFGSYNVEGSDKISFSRMGSTMMACPDLQTESEFLKSLESVSNYEVSESELILKDNGGNIISKFEAVYL